MLQCAVFPHAPVHHTLRSPLLFFPFSLNQSTIILPLKHGRKTTYFLTLVKPNRVKTCLRQGASSGALRGCFRRGPLTSRGRAGVAGSRNHQCTGRVECTGIRRSQYIRGMLYWLELPGPSPINLSICRQTRNRRRLPTLLTYYASFIEIII